MEVNGGHRLSKVRQDGTLHVELNVDFKKKIKEINDLRNRNDSSHMP